MNVNAMGEAININAMSVPELLDQIHARCQTLIIRINAAKHLDDGQVELNRLCGISEKVQSTLNELGERKIDHPTAVILHETLATIYK